jgi:hypothetical protein
MDWKSPPQTKFVESQSEEPILYFFIVCKSYKYVLELFRLRFIEVHMYLQLCYIPKGMQRRQINML